MLYTPQVKEEVADPECRQLASKAHATLHRVGGEGRVSAPSKADAKAYQATLKVRGGADAQNAGLGREWCHAWSP